MNPDTKVRKMRRRKSDPKRSRRAKARARRRLISALDVSVALTLDVIDSMLLGDPEGDW